MKRIVLILILLSAGLWAEVVSSDIVSIPAVINLANQNNLQIQIARDKYNIARAQTNQAWSTVFPKFSIAAGYNKIDSYQNRLSNTAFSSFGAAFANVPSINMSAFGSLSALNVNDIYSAKASVSQIIFNGNVMPAIIASDYGLKAAQAQLDFTKEEVYSNIFSLYLTIIQLEKNIEVLEDTKKQFDQILNKAVELQKNGLATQMDVLRSKSGLASIKVSLINLKNNLDTLYNNLELLLNTKLAVRKLDSSIINDLYQANNYPVDADLNKVINERSDYLQFENTLKLLQTNIDIQRGNYWPTVMLVGSYGYQNSTGFSFNDANRDWSYGINGNWNVFDFGTTQSKVDEAQANYEIISKQQEQMKKSIDNELTNNLHGIKAAKAKIESIEEEEKVNIEATNFTRSRYNLGDVTNLELIDAHNQLLNARSKLIEAKVEYALQVIKWLKSIGQLARYVEKEYKL
ncbi:MAG: TolC family protein [Candidatus Margulisbacteria bacterium]|nr:TolC family protein [Candidatus Margulisiibacteriota bacterium]